MKIKRSKNRDKRTRATHAVIKTNKKKARDLIYIFLLQNETEEAIKKKRQKRHEEVSFFLKFHSICFSILNAKFVNLKSFLYLAYGSKIPSTFQYGTNSNKT